MMAPAPRRIEAPPSTGTGEGPSSFGGVEGCAFEIVNARANTLRVSNKDFIYLGLLNDLL